MQLKKFRLVAMLLALMMLVTACGSATSPSGSEEKKSEESKTESKAEESKAEESKSEEGKDAPKEKGKRIALLCDVAGTQPFILDLIKGLKQSAEKYGFEVKYVECADDAAYNDNARALVNEGVDLLIGGNWQAGEAIAAVAKEFPDKAKYALIDSQVDQENVKCINFYEQEGAYLIGQIAALVTEKDQKLYGAVHVNENVGSWKWRWGYMEGVKSIKPDAKFVFNYVGSYSDPAKAKELALQQAAQGCTFINSAAAGGDSGVFEAALEKHFYTSGQDIDLTDPANPYIVTCQLKDTCKIMEYVIDLYFSDKPWTGDDETLGIKEGAIGAVYITTEGKNPPPAAMTPEIIKEVKATAEKIKSGELNLRNMPTEEEYKANNK